MNKHPVKSALRKFRREQRPPRKFCSHCIQADHTAGRNHDASLTYDLCEYHHWLLTQKRLDAGADMRFQSDPVKRVACALRADAVFCREHADAMERWADLLEKTK